VTDLTRPPEKPSGFTPEGFFFGRAAEYAACLQTNAAGQRTCMDDGARADALASGQKAVADFCR
jgi:hypothetical protein